MEIARAGTGSKRAKPWAVTAGWQIILTQQNVIDLLPSLQNFVNTGC